MRRFYLFFAILTVTMLAIQCKHDPVVAPGTPNNNDTTSNPTNPVDTTTQHHDACQPGVIYFERDVMPILNSSCAFAGCHDAETKEDDVILDNYANVMHTAEVKPGDPDGSDLYEVLVDDDEDDRMPKDLPPLAAQQIETIRKWIEQGAKNLKCTEQGGCDTANMSFKNNIHPILQTNCVTCHNGVNASAGVDLSSHGGVHTVATNGRLFGAITHAAGYKPMPQNGTGQKLDPCKIDQIKSWIDAGAKNN